MMPAMAQLEAAFGRHGHRRAAASCCIRIGTPMWATRFWWMLRSLGFDGAGCSTAVSTNGRRRAAPSRPDPQRDIRPRHSRPNRGPAFSSARTTCSPPSTIAYGRRQRAWPAIPPGPGAQPLRPAGPHSRQLQRVGGDAARSLNKIFVPLADAEAKFAAQGLRKDKRVIAYCGGGSRRPSTCSCCTGSATTISRSMTARWASGRRTSCRSRRISRLLPNLIASEG